MNKIAVATLSFTAGAIAGFAVAQFIQIEREEQNREVVTAEDIRKEQKPVQPTPEAPKVDPAELETPQDDDPSDLLSRGPAHIAMPGQAGVNYAKVQQIVKENGYTTEDEIQAVIEDPDNEETVEEREEREQLALEQAMSDYRRKNKDKIVPIQKDEWDTDFPEVDYDKKDLYYFVGDNVLTDEDGVQLDIEEYMGTRPGQFGWYSNDEERIFIRNNPKETDYQVWKQKCTSKEWW